MSLIPDSHVDLVARPLPAVLASVMPDGRPQARVVWLAYTAGVLSVNTERGRRKTKNMESDNRATIVVVDPVNQHRYIELRFDVVSVSEVGALEHRSRIDAEYLGLEHYGDPTNDKGVRVIATLEPVVVHACG